jgi:hypothetical protein
LGASLGNTLLFADYGQSSNPDLSIGSSWCFPISVLTLLRFGLRTSGALFGPIVGHYAFLFLAGLFRGGISGAQIDAVQSRRKPETFLGGRVRGLNHHTFYNH